MRNLTPQLAKLITLRLMEASMTKMYEGKFWESEELKAPDPEKVIMATAVKNQLEDLRANIKYQEKLCK